MKTSAFCRNSFWKKLFSPVGGLLFNPVSFFRCLLKKPFDTAGVSRSAVVSAGPIGFALSTVSSPSYPALTIMLVIEEEGRIQTFRVVRP